MFDWDAANINHLALHAVTQEEAEQVITSNPIDLEIQIRNGETRYPHVGETATGRILVVIVSLRGDLLRVVTGFPANRAMRKFYLEQKEQNHAEDSDDT